MVKFLIFVALVGCLPPPELLPGDSRRPFLILDGIPFYLERPDMAAIDNDVVAECSAFDLRPLVPINPYVVVDPDWWAYLATPSQRTTVILHEWGHCRRGLDHNDKMRPDSCPVSLMHPYLPEDNCWEAHKKAYMREIQFTNDDFSAWIEI